MYESSSSHFCVPLRPIKMAVQPLFAEPKVLQHRSPGRSSETAFCSVIVLAHLEQVHGVHQRGTQCVRHPKVRIPVYIHTLPAAVCQCSTSRSYSSMTPAHANVSFRKISPTVFVPAAEAESFLGMGLTMDLDSPVLSLELSAAAQAEATSGRVSAPTLDSNPGDALRR